MADISSLLGAAGIGGAIGKAIVSLELETTKYKAELAAAEGETKAATGSMAGGVTKFGGLASSAYLAAGAAAVAFAAFSVKAAVEANEAHLKLTNTFENNAKLSDSSVAAFERQADALRDLTGVDDEAIITAQALLGAFNLTGEQVQELIPLIVDLSEKYGVDSETAAKAVGKATAGNTGSLARYGIVLDKGAVQADAFAATLGGLGKNAGFAADQAKDEPWKLLGAAFEELAETVGQKLLPALQDIVEWVTEYGVPALKELLDAIISVFAPETYTSIPIIGEAFKALGTGIQGVADATDYADASIRRNGLPLLSEMQAKADLARAGFDRLGLSLPELADMTDKVFHRAGESVNKFAHMTGDDLQKWSDDTKESFRSYVINLDKVQEETDFTRKDLRDSFQAMLEHARDLNQAMRTLSKEHWINDDFVKFLAEQPDKLILFADSSEKQQQRMQAQWEKSGDILKNQVNDKLDQMTSILDKLDTGETKHKVTIQYEYKGFDPSKPGMGAQPGP